MPRYEQDAYGIRTEVCTELETVEEQQARQRRAARRKAKAAAEFARLAAIFDANREPEAPGSWEFLPY